MFRSTDRVREAFEAVVELDDRAHARTLAQASLSADEESIVVAMLAAERSQRSFFDVCAADRISELADDPMDPTSLVGSQIGPFRLAEFVGQGGSSTVFRAVRPIGDTEQEVALKMLHAGLFSPESRRRFRREQRILVKLSHPNVARLIEAGVSEAGIPYIAMEFVRGVDLITYAAVRELACAPRVRLFVDVCRAVDAVHRSLIVHRDLKPSNLLVTPDGCVKILDFGIAKPAEGHEPRTSTQNIALTPAYAAPEQYANGEVTASADVYALGVIAGELLLSERLGPGGTRRSPASGAVAATRRGLDADLMLIISTALSAEPQSRYPSAGHLADDFERYLRREPLLAHKLSATCRLRKFIARRRGPLALAAAVVLSFAGLGIFGLRQAQLAIRNESRAYSELDRANSMRDFLFEVISEAEPTRPRASATIADAADRALSTASANTVRNPRARIELLARLAAVLHSQGRREQARQLLEKLGAEVDRAFGAKDPLSLEVRRVAASNAMLFGEFAKARGLLDGLLLQRADAEQSTRILLDSAELASKERNSARALRESAQALAQSRDLGNAELLRRALTIRGTALLNFSTDEEALPVYRELLQVSRAAFGEQHVSVADAWIGMARAYRHIGDVADAQRSSAQALAIDKAVFPGDNARVAADLAESAAIAAARRDFPAALNYRREVVRMARALNGENHPMTAAALADLGGQLAETGDYAGAVAALRESHDVYFKQFGAAHWYTANVQAQLGFSLARSGDPRGGAAQLDQAIRTIETFPEYSPGLLAWAYERRARLMLDDAEPDRALAYLDKAERTYVFYPAPTGLWDGRIDTLRGEALLKSKRAQDALVCLQRARKALDASKHEDPSVSVANLFLRATALRDLGESAEAARAETAAEAALGNLQAPPRDVLALAEALRRG